MRSVLLVALAVLAFAPPASAQTAGQPAGTPDPRTTVSGVVGGGQTWDDEGSLGTGFAGGVGLDRRLFGTTYAQIGLDVLAHDRGSGYFQASGRTTLVSLSLVHRFGRAAVQPYILGGVLLAHHSGSVTFDTTRDVRSTDFGSPFGAGFTLRVRDRFEAGPEFRILLMQPDDDSNPARAFWFGMRFGYRF